MKPVNYIILTVSIIFFISCSQSTKTDSKHDGDTIIIEFPLNKKAVYANALYWESNDSSQLQYLVIQSISIEEKVTLNDTIYSNGLYEHYLVHNDTSISHYSGEFSIASTSDWILVESIGHGLGINVFQKRVSADTTAIPNENFIQFPFLPKELNPDKIYSIYRPRNTIEDIYMTFIGVFMEFTTRSIQTWEDYYGNEEGIYLNIYERIDDDNSEEFFYKSLVDQNGLITSVGRHDFLEFGQFGNSITSISINRRIVPFQNPDQVMELSNYYDLVKQNGLQKLN